MDGVTLHSQSHRKHQKNYELFLKTTTSLKPIPHLLLTSNFDSELTFKNMCRSYVIKPVKRQKPDDVFQTHVAPGKQGRNKALIKVN